MEDAAQKKRKEMVLWLVLLAGALVVYVITTQLTGLTTALFIGATIIIVSFFLYVGLDTTSTNEEVIYKEQEQKPQSSGTRRFKQEQYFDPSIHLPKTSQRINNERRVTTVKELDTFTFRGEVDDAKGFEDNEPFVGQVLDEIRPKGIDYMILTKFEIPIERRQRLKEAVSQSILTGLLSCDEFQLGYDMSPDQVMKISSYTKGDQKTLAELNKHKEEQERLKKQEVERNLKHAAEHQASLHQAKAPSAEGGLHLVIPKPASPAKVDKPAGEQKGGLFAKASPKDQTVKQTQNLFGNLKSGPGTQQQVVKETESSNLC